MCFVSNPVLYVIKDHKQFLINSYSHKALKTACLVELTSLMTKNVLVHFVLKTQLRTSLEYNISGFFKSFG